MKLQRLNNVKLELLRAGPIHGQPLSPLTPYLALCGDEGPVTFHVPFEHYRFMNRLNRLRYQVPSRRSEVADVPDSMREAELDELGRDVGKMLSTIPTLTSELGRAAWSESELFHLRIVLSGSELALIPFEALVSPQGYPGEGLPLALQTSTPITITREVRRGHPRRFEWDRVPHVLFIEASPAGLDVPTREHLLALRTALEGWIPWHADPEKRVAKVKQHLTVLLDATLPEIEGACLNHRFTHVHILAHGARLDDDSERRYGIVLCDPKDKNQPLVVDGQRLAAALTKACSQGDGTRADPPVVVTLATCDSGNPGGVLVPGGSLAHALQAFGIPWVFASQFPLTKRGSVRMVETLYEQLLSGEDPCRTLRSLRETLHINAQNDHDWASIVGYVTTIEDHDAKVDSLWVKHKRALIDRDFERSDALREELATTTDATKTAALKQQLAGHMADAEQRLAHWDGRFPDDGSKARRELRAECLGLQGAMKKRTAEVHHVTGASEKQWKGDLRMALSYYGAALELGWTETHWQMTQYLSLLAVLNDHDEPLLFKNALRWAEKELTRSASASECAWAHGTLAELEMLRFYHDHTQGLIGEEAGRKAAEHCREIVRLMGLDSFHVLSTRRQFLRYRNWWKVEAFAPIVDAAIAALSEPA
jgi:hypothetical protein